jgi:hypothetical protein
MAPNPQACSAYRLMSTVLYPRAREIFLTFLRGSHGRSAVERVKLMRLIRDAIGSEFGGRADRYEDLVECLLVQHDTHRNDLSRPGSRHTRSGRRAHPGHASAFRRCQPGNSALGWWRHRSTATRSPLELLQVP